jgi:protein SCO1/2
MLKTVRLVLWGAVALVIAVLGAVYSGIIPIGLQNSGSGQMKLAEGGPQIGGPFEMVDRQGNIVTQADLAGRKHAIFFGYTNCPDVCPMTLQEITTAVDQLPADKAEQLDVVFVSVDHERDTPEFLDNYLSAFQSPARIRGFSGNADQVAKIAKQYRIYYKKVEEEDGDILYDHTASTYLFDEQGDLEGSISFGEKPSVVIEKLENFVNS